MAFAAHVAGLGAGKVFKGDSFYEKAYTPEFTAAQVDRLSGPGKLDIPKAEAAPPTHQDGSAVTTLLNRGLHHLEHVDGKRAGEDLFQAMDKALTIPGLPTRVLEETVTRTLEVLSQADFPPGAVYAWGRRLEQKDWWQWAIRYYDAAAADFSPGTSAHSRNSSLLRAGSLRLDHNHEKDLGLRGLQMVLGNDPGGPFATEAKARLEAAFPTPR